MLSLSGQELSSSYVGWVAEQRQGCMLPSVAAWRRGATEAQEGFGVCLGGEPGGGKTVWRGLQPQVEVVSDSKRNVVASALE